MTNDQYEKREQAWAEFVESGKFRERYNSMVVAALHDAFNAGWDGRKTAVDYAIARRSEPMPPPAPQEKPA